jgi:hypothetical protein
MNISQRWQDYKNSLGMVGGSKASGYIRKLDTQNAIKLDKVKNPSKHLINKYGNKEVIPEPPVIELPAITPEKKTKQREPASNHDHDGYEDDYAVHDSAPQYDDIHVGKPKKPKAKKADKTQLTEVQEERLEKQKRELVEKKKKEIESYESTKKNVVNYKNEYGKLQTSYQKELEDLKKKKGLRKTQKEEMEQNIIKANVANIKKMKDKYKDVFLYMKNNKIKEVDQVFKHLNQTIKSMK